MIRHAKVENYVDEDISLTEEEIEHLGEFKNHSILCSPAARAIRTALVVDKNPNLQVSEALSPIKIGDFWDQIQPRMKDEPFEEILLSIPELRERIKKKGKEIQSLLDSLAEKEGPFLLLTHGECITAFLLWQVGERKWIPKTLQEISIPSYLQGVEIKEGKVEPFVIYLGID